MSDAPTSATRPIKYTDLWADNGTLTDTQLEDAAKMVKEGFIVDYQEEDGSRTLFAKPKVMANV